MDALVDSGTRTLVFVDRGTGHFEPRRVSTGWRADKYAKYSATEWFSD